MFLFFFYPPGLRTGAKENDVSFGDSNKEALRASFLLGAPALA